MDSYDHGFVLPPTPEDYKRMWEAEQNQKRESKKHLSAAQAKREAVRQVLSGTVKELTRPDPKLSESFTSEVNRALRGR